METGLNFDSSRRWIRPDIFALGAKFAELVEKQPQRFTPAGKWWENITRGEVLNKVLERAADRVARAQNGANPSNITPTEEDWGNWFGIAKWVMKQPWPKESAVRFFAKASDSRYPVPDQYFSELPEILRTIIEEDDVRLSGSQNSLRDWLTTAINSERGTAIEALLSIALHQKNSSRKIDARIFEIIDSRLRAPGESPAVFALLGAKLGLLVHLFGEQIKDWEQLLFPPANPTYRCATIISHFNYGQPWNAILQTFPHFLSAALDTLQAVQAEVGDSNGRQDRRHFGSQLGTHIACYYWNGSFVSDEDANATIDRFFAIASPTTRAAVISQIGTIWARKTDSTPAREVINRVMRIWERRFAEIERNLKNKPNSEHEKELAESTDWLECECLPFEWRIKNAKLALEKLNKAPQAYKILEAISEFSSRSDRLKSMLELLRILLKRPSNEFRWSIQFKKVAPTISIGLSSEDPETNRLAEECRDLLLKMGLFDFLHLGNDRRA